MVIEKASDLSDAFYYLGVEPIIVFITGPVKSGKSMLAQSLAKTMSVKEHLYYIATMICGDGEDKLRINRHLKDREGWGFITEELAFEPEKSLANINDTVLLDSVTALLQNLMFSENSPCKDGKEEQFISKSVNKLCKQVGNIVMVSDYIFSDAQIYDKDLTGLYRQKLGNIHQELAALADCVIEVTASCPVIHKGNCHEISQGLQLYYSLSGHLKYSDIGEC